MMNITQEEILDMMDENMFVVEEFEPTKDCVSDCFKNMEHSILCQYHVGMFTD